MTDDIKEQIKQNLAKEQEHDSAVEAQEEQQHAPSTIEQRMVQLGFDPKGPKSLEDWIEDGLQMRNEKITDLYKSINDLKDLTEKQVKTAVQKARSEWEEQRDDAIARGDVRAVKELERDKEHHELQAVIKVEAQAFMERNAEWYNGLEPEHLEMRKAALEMDNELAKQHLEPHKHFETLEKYMKKKFNSYFSPQDSEEEEPVRKRSAVESGSSVVSSKSSTKKTYTMNDLNPQQQSVAKRLIKLGHMTLEDYTKQLVAAGDL